MLRALKMVGISKTELLNVFTYFDCQCDDYCCYCCRNLLQIQNWNCQWDNCLNNDHTDFASRHGCHYNQLWSNTISLTCDQHQLGILKNWKKTFKKEASKDNLENGFTSVSSAIPFERKNAGFARIRSSNSVTMI